MTKLFIPPVCLAVAIACGSEMPTDTDDLPPALAVAGNSGCATVKFTVAGVPFVAPVPITGDLVGTTDPTFIGGTEFAGVTQKNGGTAVWNITDGVLGALTFETTFDNKNIAIDRPGSPGTFFENIGTQRALDGVQKANLTYKGTFDLITFTIDHDYHGVICP